MRRALSLIVSLPLLACTPNEPPKNADPAPSASVAPSDSASAAPVASAAPSASALPTASAAPVATVAPGLPAAYTFHGTPLNGGGDVTVPVSGKVTYIQFCASWCEPCKKLLPIAQQMYAKYKDKGLAAFAVEEDETKASVMPFAQKLGVGFPVFWDDGGKHAALWKVNTMPTGYVVDRAGMVPYTQRGYVDGDADKLEKAIVAALAAK